MNAFDDIYEDESQDDVVEFAEPVPKVDTGTGRFGENKDTFGQKMTFGGLNKNTNRQNKQTFGEELRIR